MLRGCDTSFRFSTFRTGLRGAIGGAGDSFPGGHSGREPPDPIPNSEVKTLCADGSLAVGQVRVGHCQDPIETPRRRRRGVFLWHITALGPSHINFLRETRRIR